MRQGPVDRLDEARRMRRVPVAALVDQFMPLCSKGWQSAWDTSSW